MTISPWDYLKLRREAAGVSIADIAATMVTEPRIAEHVRAGWVEQIEAGTMPASFATIVALRHAYRFDLEVLGRLVAIGLGAPLPAPRLCNRCGCSEQDPCTDINGHGCWWTGPELCSACANEIEPAQSGAPTGERG